MYFCGLEQEEIWDHQLRQLSEEQSNGNKFDQREIIILFP